MLSSLAGADIDALAERGISLRNIYGSFEAHPDMLRSWAATLPKWLLLSGELEAPSHVVNPSVDLHLINAALDDIGEAGGIRYVVDMGREDDVGEDRGDI